MQEVLGCADKQCDFHMKLLQNAKMPVYCFVWLRHTCLKCLSIMKLEKKYSRSQFDYTWSDIHLVWDKQQHCVYIEYSSLKYCFDQITVIWYTTFTV